MSNLILIRLWRSCEFLRFSVQKRKTRRAKRFTPPPNVPWHPPPSWGNSCNIAITLTLRPSPVRFRDMLSGRPPGRPQAIWKQPSEFGLRPPSRLRATKPTINVGKKLYRAADIRDVPEKLSRSPFPSQYCGQWVATHEETPHGIFFEAPAAPCLVAPALVFLRHRNFAGVRWSLQCANRLDALARKSQGVGFPTLAAENVLNSAAKSYMKMYR